MGENLTFRSFLLSLDTGDSLFLKISYVKNVALNEWRHIFSLSILSNNFLPFSEKDNVFTKRSLPFQFNARLSIKRTVSFLIKSTLYHSFHLVPFPLISIEFSFGNDVNHPIEAILNGEFNTASSKVSFLALLMSKKANKRNINANVLLLYLSKRWPNIKKINPAK